jgi:hypothetical protein
MWGVKIGILNAPWGQQVGSKRLPGESNAIHPVATDKCRGVFVFGVFYTWLEA